MKKTIILLIFLQTIPLFAEDSLSISKYDSLAEVVVTGVRNQTDIRYLSQSVSIIDRGKIERTLQPSLLPILTEQVPGLFTTARGVMGYGVSGGASGSISIRGLSGGTGQISMLMLISLVLMPHNLVQKITYSLMLTNP